MKIHPCSARGERIGERECPTCGNRKVKLHVFACPKHPDGVTIQDCRKHQRAGECGDAIKPEPLVGSLSLVVPACNEKDLPKTIQSFQQSVGHPIKTVIVDDASDTAIPGAAIRNERHQGAAACRALGILKATSEFVCTIDAHMRFPVGLPQSLVKLAADTDGIAYCGCNHHFACELRVVPDKLLECKWYSKDANDKKLVGLVRTTGLMGACTVVRKSTLMKMGGWPMLPGRVGSEELTLAMLAARCGIPITADTSLQTWHQFRRNDTLPYPPDLPGFFLNQAVAFRLCFEDEYWPIWRKRLAASTPESILNAVERPHILEYGRRLRERFTVSAEEFMAPYGGLSDG